MSLVKIFFAFLILAPYFVGEPIHLLQPSKRSVPILKSSIICLFLYNIDSNELLKKLPRAVYP